MSFLKRHRYKLIALLFAAAVLSAAFWRSGVAPGLYESNADTGELIIEQASQTPEASEISESGGSDTAADDTDGDKAEEDKPEEDKPEENNTDAEQLPEGSAAAVLEGDMAYSEENGMELDEAAGKDLYRTEPVPEGKPLPVEPQDVLITDKELTCTLSVRCDTILDNIERLDSEKLELVPSDGVILAEQTVAFYEGESVFNLLLREMKKNKIHLEFENTPMYNSTYIEGIGNLYEHDCGELSGWMYKVNGWFPNYGCSRYQLKAGDKVEWVYTCNLGADVGGNYAAAGE